MPWHHSFWHVETVLVHVYVSLFTSDQTVWSYVSLVHNSYCSVLSIRLTVGVMPEDTMATIKVSQTNHGQNRTPFNTERGPDIICSKLALHISIQACNPCSGRSWVSAMLCSFRLNLLMPDDQLLCFHICHHNVHKPCGALQICMGALKGGEGHSPDV